MSNRSENRRFHEAVRRIERALGRKLSPQDRRRLHDEVTAKRYTLNEIVDVGLALFHR